MDRGRSSRGKGRLAAHKARLLDRPRTASVGVSRGGVSAPRNERAYVLADNQLAAKAGWDREILAIELQALVDLDFEVELTGFETAEVDLILEEAQEAAGGPGTLAPLPGSQLES
jgi:hypothetical protein